MTNRRVLEATQEKNLVSSSLVSDHSIIIPPCFIGDNVRLVNAVIGPYVSVGANSVVQDSVISDSIIQANSKITSAVISNSMIGNHASYAGSKRDLSIGDFNILSETAN
jgi:glucose-1-phosphate thymidylyltransferase